jgi:hypothetical protein
MGVLRDRVQEVHSKSEPFRKLSNNVRGNIFGERVINCKFLHDVVRKQLIFKAYKPKLLLKVQEN